MDAAFLLLCMFDASLPCARRSLDSIHFAQSVKTFHLKMLLIKKEYTRVVHDVSKKYFQVSFCCHVVTFSLKGDFSRPCTTSHHV